MIWTEEPPFPDKVTKVRLLYPLYVNKTVHEGQRKDAIHFHWNDKGRELSIERRNGQFSGMLQSRQFKLVAVDSSSVRQVLYHGKKITLGLSK